MNIVKEKIERVTVWYKPGLQEDRKAAVKEEKRLINDGFRLVDSTVDFDSSKTYEREIKSC